MENNIYDEISNEVEKLVLQSPEMIMKGATNLRVKIHKMLQILYQEGARIEFEFDKEYSNQLDLAKKNLRFADMKRADVDAVIFGKEPMVTIRSKQRDVQWKIKSLENLIDDLKTASYDAKELVRWQQFNAGEGKY